MATTTDTATSPSTAHGHDGESAAETNPLAPTHSRPHHPHHKTASRRLTKKNRQRRGEPLDDLDSDHHSTDTESRRGSRRARRPRPQTSTPMSALLVPMAALIGVALYLRLHR